MPRLFLVALLLADVVLHKHIVQAGCCMPEEFSVMYERRTYFGAPAGLLDVSVDVIRQTLDLSRLRQRYDFAMGTWYRLEVQDKTGTTKVYHVVPANKTCVLDHVDTDVVRKACVSDRSIKVGEEQLPGAGAPTALWIQRDSLPNNNVTLFRKTTVPSGDSCLFQLVNDETITFLNQTVLSRTVAVDYFFNLTTTDIPPSWLDTPAYCPL